MIVVVGGGVIGLAAAHGLGLAGHEVVVLDPDPGRGATWAAAGMLAPLSELEYGHEALFRLNLAGAARWETWADELEARTGVELGYRRTGSMLVARDRDDRRQLDDMAEFAASLGQHLESRRGRQCRELEPWLSPSIVGGLLADADHSVDPRRVVEALLVGLDDQRVTRRPDRVAALLHGAGRVRGVRLDDGTELVADEVVLAAGVASRHVAADVVDLAVRPVKGERLALRAGPGQARLDRVVRGLVRGSGVYLVPRADGEVVVGATVLEVGQDTSVTAGGIWELLRDAREVVPGITEWELVEAVAGLRPGTPDNGPLLGRPDGVEGLVVASGHHRNGVLLAPLTADTVVAVVDGAAPDPITRPFGPDRFARRTTAPDTA